MKPPTLPECRYDDTDRHAIQGAGRVTGLHLAPEVVRNLAVFSSFSRQTLRNLRTRAFSPFTGEPVEPLAHFGIDPDPWMHSILYRERGDGDGHWFIVICLGLTPNSVLG